MEIAPGLHLVIPAPQLMDQVGVGQAYLFEERNRLTLFDTGSAADADVVLTAIEGMGRRPEDLQQIVVSHYHADHVGALAAVAERTGARVLAHALDAPVVRGERAPDEPKISDAERPFFEQAIEKTPEAPPARVDRELQDGEEIELDGGAKVVHVPGHTPGSLALYVPGKRVLLTGDAVAGVDDKPIVGVFNVDPGAARESFRRLAELEFDVACFGHGKPLDKDASLAFRRAAEKLR